jgi:hypothetical protein
MPPAGESDEQPKDRHLQDGWRVIRNPTKRPETAAGRITKRAAPGESVGLTTCYARFRARDIQTHSYRIVRQF